MVSEQEQVQAVTVAVELEPVAMATGLGVVAKGLATVLGPGALALALVRGLVRGLAAVAPAVLAPPSPA